MYTIYAEMSLEEREKVLANIAAKKEMRNYRRPLDYSEVQARQGDYVQQALQMNELKEQMENAIKNFKAQIKNLELRQEETLKEIDTKSRETSGVLYGLANQDLGRMMFYNKYGTLIDSRDLLPEERQANLFLDGAKPDAHRNRNAALTDLPIETANIVESITGKLSNEYIEEAQEVADMDGGVAGEHDRENVDKEYLKSIPHNEDGWERMSDAQLSAKYGTVNIDDIRKMVNRFGKWVMPKVDK